MFLYFLGDGHRWPLANATVSFRRGKRIESLRQNRYLRHKEVGLN
jgi:hypothetical protein